MDSQKQELAQILRPPAINTLFSGFCNALRTQLKGIYDSHHVLIWEVGLAHSLFSEQNLNKPPPTPRQLLDTLRTDPQPAAADVCMSEFLLYLISWQIQASATSEWIPMSFHSFSVIFITTCIFIILKTPQRNLTTGWVTAGALVTLAPPPPPFIPSKPIFTVQPH